MAFITAGDANVPPAGSTEKYLRACFLAAVPAAPLYLIGKGRRVIKDSFQEQKTLALLDFVWPSCVRYLSRFITVALHVSLLPTDAETQRKPEAQGHGSKYWPGWETGKDWSGSIHQEGDCRVWRDDLAVEK